MEEADGIILLSLQQIGASFLEGISVVSDIDGEKLFYAVSLCVQVIQGSASPKLPTWPKEMSSRYRVCSSIAKTVSGLGYSGELSYNKFLYPEAATSRAVLRWLVERLPKEEDDNDNMTTTGQSGLSPADDMRSSILQTLHKNFAQPWRVGLLPHWSEPSVRPPFEYTEGLSPFQGIPHCYIHSPQAVVSLSGGKWFLQHGKSQPGRHIPGGHPSLLATFISYCDRERTRREMKDNEEQLGELCMEKGAFQKRLMGALRMGGALPGNKAADLEGGKISEGAGGKEDKEKGSASRFQHQTAFAKERTDMVGEDGPEQAEQQSEAEKQEDQLAVAESQLQKVRTALEDLASEMKSLKSQQKKIHGAMKELKQTDAADAESTHLKQRTADLLANPSAMNGHLEELQRNAAMTADRLTDLATEWESVRVPLVSQLRSLRAETVGREEKSQWQLAAMRDMRREMKDMVATARSKEEHLQALTAQAAKIQKKSIQSEGATKSRAEYSERLIEINRNVRRQKMEMNKMLGENFKLRKEIADMQETLGRSFSAADELFFAEAKNSADRKEMYRSLVGIHDGYASIVKDTDQVVSTSSTISDMESQVQELSGRLSASALEGMQRDLAAMEEENKQLVMRLKQLRK